MTRTTISQLLALCVLSLAAVWIVLQLLARQGVYLPMVSWHQGFACLILAGLVTWGGLSVRKYIAGKKPELSGLFAARIAVFAKACSLGGVIFVGWYGGQVLLALQNISIESQQQRALWAGIAALTALILSVCGVIAERNCQIPPSEPEEDAGSTAGNPA
jgi:hypothetical protein